MESPNSFKSRQIFMSSPLGILMTPLYCWFYGIPELLQVPADLHELSARHLDDTLVLLVLRNSEVLSLDIEKLQGEVGDTIFLLALENELDVIRIIVRLEGHAVVVVAELEDLRERLH